MVGATLVTCYQLGPVFQPNTSWAGFLPLRVAITDDDRARHADLYGLIAEIPGDASVAAGEMLVAQVSSLKNAYNLIHGHFDADYLLTRSPPPGTTGTNRSPRCEPARTGSWPRQATRKRRPLRCFGGAVPRTRLRRICARSARNRQVTWALQPAPTAKFL